jgi:hypothetical protein
MANYCSNWVSFSGKKENLQKLHDALRYAESLNAENQGLIWYETFYAALGLDVPSEPTDVYDMFGSKWLHIDEIDVYDTELELIGSSAWSPVVPFVALLCQKFNLTAKGEYDESGCDFGGFYSVDKDNNVKEDTYNYLSYRYLSEGIEGVLSELSYYESFDDKIERLNEAKAVMSKEDYNEMLNEIKNLHKPIN